MVGRESLSFNGGVGKLAANAGLLRQWLCRGLWHARGKRERSGELRCRVHAELKESLVQ